MLSGLAPLRSAVCRASGALTAAARGMAVTAQQLEDRLKEHLQATHVAVTDTSGGCGASFALEVVSPSFEGAGRCGGDNGPRSMHVLHRHTSTTLAVRVLQTCPCCTARAIKAPGVHTVRPVG